MHDVREQEERSNVRPYMTDERTVEYGGTIYGYVGGANTILYLAWRRQWSMASFEQYAPHSEVEPALLVDHFFK